MASVPQQPESPAQLAERRRRAVRGAVILAVVVAAIYLGFIFSRF